MVFAATQPYDSQLSVSQPSTSGPSGRGDTVSYLRYVGRRAAFAVLSTYVVASLGFLLGNAMLEWVIGKRTAIARYGGASQEEVRKIEETFASLRGLDASLGERYVDWLVNVTTLEWGYSFAYRSDVSDVLAETVPTTLEYVVPGVLLAVVLGVLLGVFAALAKDTAGDWVVRLASYVLLGVPAFMVVLYIQLGAPEGLIARDGLVNPKTIAAVTVAVGLLASQLRFARVAALEQLGRSFVTLLRAKGAGRRRLARHVLKNAALPIASTSISELLAVLALQIYVIEAVLGIHGLARASLDAIAAADVALVVWTTMVIVVIGIAATFLTDVVYGALDPRIAT